jgi:hypothetical protein
MNAQIRPILLVEDNPLDVDLTLRSFSKRNLANPIEIARDGVEALAYIPRWESGQQLPILIMLDINLPKVSGLEVLRALRAHPVYQRVPVVLLISSEDDREYLGNLALDGISFLVKPVNFEKFAALSAQIGLSWSVGNAPNS